MGGAVSFDQAPEMLVSVVTATYNRSNVLRHAIDSVRWQTLADWELIIVGDACTDDTASVVASYGDERIHFVNRAENFGEQSAPNNDGVAMARGKYVAFLNHDDLWLPRHLAASIESLESRGADLVFTEPLLVYADGTSSVAGITARGRYEPWLFVAASGWLFRRELASSVGPWPAAHDHFNAPSQEWLARAWRGGAVIASLPKVTWISIGSSVRRGSYAERQEAEQVHWMERLRTEPDFVERELGAIAIRDAAANADPHVRRHVVRAAKGAFRRLCVIAGMHPHALRNAIVDGRRGGSIDRARSVRGLPPLVRRRPEES